MGDTIQEVEILNDEKDIFKDIQENPSFIIEPLELDNTISEKSIDNYSMESCLPRISDINHHTVLNKGLIKGNLGQKLKLAQEPWPKDVKLFQPYEVEQILLPDNANCLAVQTFLRMCGLDFHTEYRVNAEAMSPSGKVPFIKAGAFVVSELDHIVQFVNSKGISLSEKLDNSQRSDMRVYMALVNSVLEIAELYICWCDKETYKEITSIRYGSVYPWPLNYIQTYMKRSQVIKKLKVLDWYQKSLEDVLEEVDNCCQALVTRLDDKDYFFDQPTELDALVFGHIFSIITTPLSKSYLADTVRGYPGLLKLVRGIENKYFKKPTELIN